MMTDIHVRAFTGSSLKPYLHAIAKLRMEVFKEYPYFETPDLDREIHYLKHISTCKETIGVLIFDGTTLVGVSLGCPLAIEDPLFLTPFNERHLDISSYFYFGDSALLKEYRGRGIGHHFFDAREAHVAHYKKYKHICFSVPNCPDHKRPQECFPLDDFWRRRGYHHHPEMHCHLLWQDVEEGKPAERTLTYWIKDLKVFLIWTC